MPLIVTIRTENGRVEAVGSASGVARLVAAGRTQGLPYLSGVDGVEDTWFNSRQIPFLVHELDQLETGGDVVMEQAAEEIRTFAGTASRKPLRYVVFVGN